MFEMEDLDEDDAALRAAVAQWRRGEEQLYLTALHDVDVYRCSLELVRRTVDHLRGLGPGHAALLAVSGRGAGLVADALGSDPIGPAAVRSSLVADAALALRYREVVAERTVQHRLDRLRHGRERGDTWVLLETAGDPEGDPMRPYRRLEAAARTGLAVLVTTAPNADFTGSLHAVEAVRVDLRSGALHEVDDLRGAATTHASATAREQRASTLRGQLTEQ